MVYRLEILVQITWFEVKYSGLRSDILVYIPIYTLTTMENFRQFHSSKKPDRMPDFEKMMKKLSENNDMMMMEYAAFFRKEVEVNFVPRP